MNKNLLILGAGQYGTIAKEVAESMKYFNKINFLDDKNEIAIGKLDELDKFCATYKYAFVAIGNPQIRSNYIERLKEKSYSLVSLISPKACISTSAIISAAAIVEPMASVNAEAVIQMGSIISSGAVINHNSVVGRCCHIDCNAVVASNAHVADMTKIDYGCIYLCKD